MFNQFTMRGLSALALAITVLAGGATADIILPTGLPPGSQFQIAFVTADTIDAFGGGESTYNTFVASEVNASPTLASLGVAWTAITTTRDGTDACDNAPTYAGVPIYDTQGNLLSATGMLYLVWNTNWPYGWAGGLDSPIMANQFGVSIASGTSVWTGSNPDGRKDVTPGSEPLGALQMGDTSNYMAMVAVPGASDRIYWMTAGGDNFAYYGTTIYHPVYALSSRITVAPEPGTLVLLGMATLGLGLVHLRRRSPTA